MAHLFNRPEAIKIQSFLSPEECVGRLKNATKEDTLFGTMLLPAGTFICKLNKDKFTLRQKRSYRNSFGPHFYGRLRQTGSGTEIEGEFRMHTPVFAFTCLWLGGVVLIGGTLAVTCLVQLMTGHNDHGKNGNPLLGILIPVFMFAVGIVMIKFGQWLGKWEERAMTQFLRELFS